MREDGEGGVTVVATQEWQRVRGGGGGGPVRDLPARWLRQHPPRSGELGAAPHSQSPWREARAEMSSPEASLG